METIASITKELAKKHNVSIDLLHKLEKESKRNQYEKREEAKKVHELLGLINMQIVEDKQVEKK